MITNIVLGICLVAYATVKIEATKSNMPTVLIKYGALLPSKVRRTGEYWRFISTNFLHANILHIVVNVYVIYVFGRFFEQFLGVLGFVYLLLMSGIGSSLLTYIVSKRNNYLQNTITIGASGLFYGMLGAIIVLGLLYPDQYANMLQGNLMIIMLNIIITMITPSFSKTAHLGGMLGGMIATVYLILVNYGNIG